jgi:predicted HTH domain antitoxin
MKGGGSAADAVLTTALAQIALNAGATVSYAGILTAVFRCYSDPMTTLTLELPDDIAQALAAHGDLSRRALEALAVDGFRQKRLTQAQVGRLLGLARIETEQFLAQYVDLYDYSMTELEAEADLLHRLTG